MSEMVIFILMISVITVGMILFWIILDKCKSKTAKAILLPIVVIATLIGSVFIITRPPLSEQEDGVPIVQSIRYTTEPNVVVYIGDSSGMETWKVIPNKGERIECGSLEGDEYVVCFIDNVVCYIKKQYLSYNPPEEETQPSTEFETDYNIESVDLDAVEEPETEEDLSYLVTSTQYTLGYGVRARSEPSMDGKIVHVFYDAFTPVDVIEEGDWYKCLIDNQICYIVSRYIGDEEDIEYVKQKWALEEKRKTSAYYNVFKNMTEEDEDLLVRILALEAENEDFDGKCAVVEVIMNRVISSNPSYPNTVHEVLMQSGQFTTKKWLDHPYVNPSKEDYMVIDYVRDNGATAIRKFLDNAGMTNINSLDYVFFATYKANGRDFIKHGGHYFGRETNKKYWHAVWKK